LQQVLCLARCAAGDVSKRLRVTHRMLQWQLLHQPCHCIRQAAQHHAQLLRHSRVCSISLHCLCCLTLRLLLCLLLLLLLCLLL
jgi:hypothetical protein